MQPPYNLDLFTVVPTTFTTFTVGENKSTLYTEKTIISAWCFLVFFTSATPSMILQYYNDCVFHLGQVNSVSASDQHPVIRHARYVSVRSWHAVCCFITPPIIATFTSLISTCSYPRLANFPFGENKQQGISLVCKKIFNHEEHLTLFLK